MRKKIRSAISIFFNQRKKTPRNYPFVMHLEEKELFKRIIQNSKCFLEFGLGGSTIFSLINSQTTIVSVDTNKEWIGFMKKYRIIRENLEKRLKIYYIDIGATRQWGFPVDESSIEKFPDFSSKIFYAENPSQFDTVLIDARFRVACVLQTILHCYKNPNLKILIHDYSIRKEYHEVEIFLDIIEHDRSLYVFKIKDNIDLDLVQNTYEKYKNIPD